MQSHKILDQCTYIAGPPPAAEAGTTHGTSSPKGSYLSFHLSISAYDVSRGPDLFQGRIDHKN